MFWAMSREHVDADAVRIGGALIANLDVEEIPNTCLRGLVADAAVLGIAKAYRARLGPPVVDASIAAGTSRVLLDKDVYCGRRTRRITATRSAVVQPLLLKGPAHDLVQAPAEPAC
jgi:hypothetical protein